MPMFPLSSTVVIAFSGFLIILLRCGFYLFSGAASIQKPTVTIGGWGVLGIIMVLVPSCIIASNKPTTNDIVVSGGRFGVMVAGILAKWTWDASLRNPFRFDQLSLFRALLVAPLVLLAGWR